MFGLGVPELLIVLVIILVLFGVGRISKIGKELGTGIRSFREGIGGDESEKTKDSSSSKDSNV